MNEEIKLDAPWENYPRLCATLFWIGVAFFIPYYFSLIILSILNKIGETLILDLIIISVGIPFLAISLIFLSIMVGFCIDL